MGVKTNITLYKLNCLFPTYHFTHITPTRNGVIDTTYIVSSSHHTYILKHYERTTKNKIFEDASRLQILANVNLNVPVLLAHNQGWYLYTKLSGSSPTNTSTRHIVAVARFLSNMHTTSQYIQTSNTFLANYPLITYLQTLKKHSYFYYKKLQSLATYTHNNDGFIHGDLFKDNCVFEKNTIGVFDFIDGGTGSFAFDCGVTLIAFTPTPRKHYNTQLFLRVYNQHAPYKLTYKQLQNAMKNAQKLYALLRIMYHKKTVTAKQLLTK